MTKPLVTYRRPGQSVFNLATGVLDDLFEETRERRTFVEWIDDKRERISLRIDGKLFTWDGFEPLKHVYEAIGSHQEVDLIKSAQMGATVMELLAVLYRAEEHPGTSHGFYFPTMGDVSDLSKIRFRPIARQLGVGQYGGEAGKDPDTVMAVIHKGSPIYFRYMGGRMSMDSIPLDSLTFDEMRLMDDPDVDQVMERISGSPHQWILCASTAGYPNCDIDRRFQEGQMFRWLSKCGACGFSFCMALEWPKCVAVKQSETDLEDAWYICVKCQRPMDPLEGEWVAEYPDRDRPGYHLHQMLARHNTAEKIWRAWTRTRNKAEFYRAKLGLPYIDATAVPLSLAILRGKQVDNQLRWQLDSDRQDSYIGIDQRGAENHVVILGPHPSKAGEIVLRHVEIVQDEDPWQRCAELVRQYRVDYGIVDALPNKNEAIRFAKEFPARIFVAYYDTHDPKSADVARWGDTGEKPAVKKADQEAKYEHTVRVARYQAIGWAIDLWLQGRAWSPEPEALIQTIRIKGRDERMSPVDSHYATLQRYTLFKHLCSIAREIEQDDETGQIKRARWVNLGLDPHFLHAYTYAAVAWTRAGGRPLIINLDPQSETTNDGYPKTLKEELLLHGMAAQGDATNAVMLADMDVDLEAVCSKCSQWKANGAKGFCDTQGMVVAPDALKCDWFLEKENPK